MSAKDQRDSVPLPLFSLIGTALGAGMILTLWVMGDIIIGMLVLFTRRKKIIEVEE